YIINTGHFLGKKIGPQTTLGLIEEIVEEKAEFVPFGPFSDLEYLPIEGFVPDFSDDAYLKLVKARLQDRREYVSMLDEFNRLPDEALEAIRKITEEI
ncbi:MAG TPA: phosphoenolpyruvate carboxykinase, partial [Acholeplasmataceae bacterium]|nr:phosphoenolpyruvate carboxykinase [Acholeplasmataceae bacterium]